MSLRSWLDPPAVVERKRLQRAVHGVGQSGADRQLQIGCFVPIALVLAIGIAVGVLLGMRAVPPAGPERATVRVIDDGAKNGLVVLAMAVVPLR